MGLYSLKQQEKFAPPKSTWKNGKLDEIVFMNWEVQRAITIEEDSRKLMFKNLRMYFGVNYGQWETSVVQALKDENREPETLNFLFQKMNTLAGSILANDFFIDFIPLKGKNNSLIQDLHDMYLSDKQLMRWDASDREALVLGLNYVGDQQMVMDYSTDPIGAIKFVTRQPGLTIYDPFWKTPYSADCRKGWGFGYLTLDQISKTYGIPLSVLEFEKAQNQRIEDYEKMGVDYPANLYNRYGSLNQVIEKHEMKESRIQRLVDFSKGYNGLPFPAMDARKKENIAYLKAWGEKNGADWEHVQAVDATLDELSLRRGRLTYH